MQTSEVRSPNAFRRYGERYMCSSRAQHAAALTQLEASQLAENSS